jgi:hypothetical protein
MTLMTSRAADPRAAKSMRSPVAFTIRQSRNSAPYDSPQEGWAAGGRF